MAAPTLTFELGLGSTWTTEDASVSWTDVSDYVHDPAGFGSSRGRSKETDDDKTGTASLRLKNADRRFDPTHATGPYYGDLLPGVPLRVTATPSGESARPVFRGFIEGWPQDYDRGNTFAWVDVRCVDGFARLAAAGMRSSVYAAEVAADDPLHWWRLAENAGSIVADVGSSPVPGAYLPALTTADHPNPWETVGGVEFDVDRIATATKPLALPDPYSFEFLMVPRFEGTASASVSVGQGIYGGSGMTVAYQFLSGDQGYVDVRREDPNDTIVDARTTTGLGPTTPLHVVVETDGPTVYVNGDAIATSSSFAVFLAAGMRVGWQGNYDPFVVADLAVYDGALDSTRVAAHFAAFSAPWDADTTGERLGRLLDVADWPSDLRDIATGISILGPAVLGDYALPLLKRAEKAEQGRMFISRDGKLTFLDRYYWATVTEGTTSQATFSDDGSDNGYTAIAFDYDTTMVRNRIRASRRGGTEVEVIDAASITAHGDAIDTQLVGLDFRTDHEARSAAEFRKLNYAQPKNRVRPVTVELAGLSAAQQAELLDLELGYRVTVERTPQGVGSAITQECTVEGITHRAGSGSHKITYALAPVADHFSTVALWGTGEWGDGEWGY